MECLRAWAVEWAAAWAAWTTNPKQSMNYNSRASKGARLFCGCNLAFIHDSHPSVVSIRLRGRPYAWNWHLVTPSSRFDLDSVLESYRNDPATVTKWHDYQYDDYVVMRAFFVWFSFDALSRGGSPIFPGLSPEHQQIWKAKTRPTLHRLFDHHSRNWERFPFCRV